MLLWLTLPWRPDFFFACAGVVQRRGTWRDLPAFFPKVATRQKPCHVQAQAVGGCMSILIGGVGMGEWKKAEKFSSVERWRERERESERAAPCPLSRYTLVLRATNQHSIAKIPILFLFYQHQPHAFLNSLTQVSRSHVRSVTWQLSLVTFPRLPVGELRCQPASPPLRPT